MQLIPPPPSVSNRPDKATAEGLRDYTGNEASDRVLRINVGIFKYGTNDKIHAAAIALSLVLLIIIVGICIAGFFSSNVSWVEKLFNWATNSFLFIAGIALGKGASTKGTQHEAD